MRLSSRNHGLADIVLALILVLVSFTLLGGVANAAGGTAVGVAAAILVNMLLTDFEMGIVRTIQIPVHLWIDGLLGLFLALSPWLFGFDRDAWIPHVVAGVLLMVFAFLTNTVPAYDRRSGSAVPR